MKKKYQRKKRSQESRIQNQTISTRTKISPKKCQELRKRSVERLSDTVACLLKNPSITVSARSLLTLYKDMQLETHHRKIAGKIDSYLTRSICD